MKLTSLVVDKLSCSFRGPDGSSVCALDKVSFQVNAGDFINIVGHNGSGKTSLLSLLRGVLTPTSGTATFTCSTGSQDLFGIPQRRRAQLVSYLHQDPKLNTFQSLTVLDNFWLASHRGVPWLGRFRPPAVFTSRVLARLGEIGLTHRIGSRLGELSQGQRQLVALEIQLLSGGQPSLLLLDEHTASLDRRNAAVCMTLTERWCKREGVTAINVTHKLGDAIHYGNRIIVLNDGRVVADIGPKEKEQLDVSRLMQLSGMDEGATIGPSAERSLT
jgi:putative tryptophan/tyrosine transport system ATP-binding protein